MTMRPLCWPITNDRRWAARDDHGSRRGRAGIGLIAPCPPGHATDFELRAFFGNGQGAFVEDPVTGSLNAAAAQYLFGAGLAQRRYVAAQGRKVGADGRVICVQDDDGAVWVAGRTDTVLQGGALLA